ncbi:hypothetical protein V8G54_031499 [Vigna mungo]|uniref:Uncharacterized protein n=1 Tax=Vigna mungo TaxID=3915 RepID=A0AAQ3RFV3_VIGMU
MENLLGEREPSLLDGGKDTGTPTAAQALTGGVETLQIEGSFKALFKSIFIPMASGLPSKSHKQMGLVSINPANPGQHPWSGCVKLLPSSTKVRQSDMFDSAKKQLSTPGAGAAAVSGVGDGADVAEEASARSKAMVRAVAVDGIILLV